MLNMNGHVLVLANIYVDNVLKNEITLEMDGWQTPKSLVPCLWRF